MLGFSGNFTKFFIDLSAAESKVICFTKKKVPLFSVAHIHINLR